MSEYLKMVHEIEAKKEHLECRIAQAVQAEISVWQQENKLAVKGVYLKLTNTDEILNDMRL
ncbi:hypothetical protein D9M71_16340 [compost metagenome]